MRAGFSVTREGTSDTPLLDPFLGWYIAYKANCASFLQVIVLHTWLVSFGKQASQKCGTINESQPGRRDSIQVTLHRMGSNM